MKNKTLHVPPLRRRLARAPLFMLALWAPVSTAGEGVEDAPAPPIAEEPGVVPRPTPEGVPALQMSTDYARPGLGFGTYAPIAQAESRGFRIEPFTVRAAVQTAVGYDDNVSLSGTNKVGSMFYNVSPSIAVGLEGALQRYYAVYRGNYGVYSSSAQDDYADHNLALSAAHSWTTRLRTLLNYDYTYGHTPRGITTTSTASSEKWTQQSFRGTANYGAAGAQGGLQGEVGHTSRRYSGSTGAAISEYDRFDVAGSFSYRVAPKTRAVVEAGWADVDHPSDRTLDNREMRYSVGVTWEALARTTGRARVGYTVKEFENSTRSDFSGESFEVAVAWAPRLQTAFDIGASRFLSESYEAGSSYVVNTVGTLVWNQGWARGVRTTVNYAYGRAEFEGINRTDAYHNVGARASYPLRRSLRIGAEFRRDMRDSRSPTLDYTRNLMLLTLETAL